MGRATRTWTIPFMLAMLVGLPLLLQQGGTLAQSPPPTPTPQTSQVLLSAVLTELPAPPAFLRLVRITVQPGARIHAHRHSGPEFNLIEQGQISIQVDGESVLAQAAGDGTPAPPRIPPINQPFDLRPGDQIVYPAGVSMEFTNNTEQPATFLAVVVLPAGPGRPEGATWVDGTPTAEDSTGVTSRIMGDAVASGWPTSPLLLQVDRLALKPGEDIPAQPGPVMLSVELGQFAFALVNGEYQVSRGADGPQIVATPGAAQALNVNDAVFFPGGMNAVPRAGDDSVLVLLRLSITAYDDGSGAASETAVSDADPAETPVPTVAPETSAATDTPDAEPGGLANGSRATVTETGVRLRATASTEGEVVAGLDAGQEVSVTGDPVESDGLVWIPISTVDEPVYAGYIAEQFLQPAP